MQIDVLNARAQQAAEALNRFPAPIMYGRDCYYFDTCHELLF
jgi:hypothetical protein